MSWPPQLSVLKEDLGEEYQTVLADDDRLQQNLDAAVYFVERIHKGRFNFDNDPESECPDPETDTVWLGTIRLAGRWFTRRRSPDMLMSLGDMGGARVPSFDPDIDRMLRIGRHQRARVG